MVALDLRQRKIIVPSQEDKSVTIDVGIIARKDSGLVIASDSQAGSFRGVHVKRLDYSKIYDFTFDGHE